MIKPLNTHLRISDTAVQEAARVIDQAIAKAGLQHLTPSPRTGPGAPTRRVQYSPRLILIGLYLLALTSQRATVAALNRLFWSQLHDHQLQGLGISEAHTSESRQRMSTARGQATEYERVRQALDGLIDPIDPSPHRGTRRTKQINAEHKARLRRVTTQEQAELDARRADLLRLCNAIISTSLPAQPAHHRGDLAIDAVIIEANAKTGGSGTRPELPRGADPDAGWWEHTQRGTMWGYALTLSIASHHLYGPRVPNIAVGMSIDAANGGNTEQAIESIQAAIDNGYGPRSAQAQKPHVIADRGFTHKTDFHSRIHSLGYAQVADYNHLAKQQMPSPIQHTWASGPIQYQGVILCPGARGLAQPEADPTTGEIRTHPGGTYDPRSGQVLLQQPAEEPWAADPVDLQHKHNFQELLETHLMPVNRPLRFQPNGEQRGRPNPNKPTNPTHSITVTCPAAAGWAACPLRPNSLRNRNLPEIHNPPTAVGDEDHPLPTCCTNGSGHITLHLDNRTMKAHQPHMHGSDHWVDRYSASRALNEQWHSQLQSPQSGSLQRGHFELTGIARVAIICSIVTAVTNRAQVLAYEKDLRKNLGVPPPEGRVNYRRYRDAIVNGSQSRTDVSGPLAA